MDEKGNVLAQQDAFIKWEFSGFTELFTDNTVMIRWVLLYYLTFKDIVRISSMSQELRQIMFSTGKYATWDQGHIKKHFRK